MPAFGNVILMKPHGFSRRLPSLIEYVDRWGGFFFVLAKRLDYTTDVQSTVELSKPVGSVL